MEANIRAFKAGYHFGETAELFESSYEVKPAKLEPGEYVNITGNTAAAWGLIAASHRSGLPLFLGTYPITPASDILHELSKHKQFGVRTFQAEDEISGIGAALGAAFGGALGVTTTSGPGHRPQVGDHGAGHQPRAPAPDHRHPAGRTVHRSAHQDRTGRPAPCHVRPPRRGAPSHRGRHDAVALLRGGARGGPDRRQVPHAGDPALRRLPGQRVPSRGGCPTSRTCPTIDPGFATGPNHTDADGTAVFWPYIRDEETLARPWAPPGVAGLEHRIGGLEKADGSGNVAYDGPNHERMTRLRAAKIAGIAHDIPPTDVDDEEGAEVLVIGWGSTYGAIAAGVQRVRARGHKVAQAHLVHLNPFPADSGDVLRRYKRVLVPEVNLGQLSRLLRAEYLVDAISFTQVQGIPFRAAAMEVAILQQIEGLEGSLDEGAGDGPTSSAMAWRPPRPAERVSTDDRSGRRP